MPKATRNVPTPNVDPSSQPVMVAADWMTE
jgi:hypothetical protein